MDQEPCCNTSENSQLLEGIASVKKNIIVVKSDNIINGEVILNISLYIVVSLPMRHSIFISLKYSKL